jgi:S-disulfanyl-L-cysteine oxidoreductase SoxD
MHGRFTVAALVVMTAAAAWFHGVAKAQGGGRTVWDGVYSAAQAELGKHRYSGQCGSCHGRAMEGGHIFGSRTRTAPALRGEAFLSHWIGHSVGDLFNQISTYMPLDHPGSLGDEVNTTILAFIMQENGFPPGSRDLPADMAVMETIQIAGSKK